VGHNVEIGENTVIAAQTGIAGSTKIGNNCMIGGQVGFAGHITVGNNVRIQGKTGVTKSVKDGEVLQGNPAMSYKEYYKSYVHFKNLPTIVEEVEKLKTNSK
jgi:UDP-3-O-[3-hydroxymyristoyl] glucosamine N-acyltransferase